MTARHPTNAVRTTVWAMGLFYLLIAFEFFYMATPFAVYFYGAYLPGLQVLDRNPALAWLTSFYLPHYATTSSALIDSARVVGGVLTAVGVLGFLIGAAQVYTRKLLGRGAAVGGIYRFLRHPQYASLILAGVGMLLLWPRFLMVVSFITMLFAYYTLAAIEERECVRKYGQAYVDYQQVTPRFLPFRLPFRLPSSLRLARRWRLSARPWPIRLVAWALAYVVATSCAVGLAFAVQGCSLRHLYTSWADHSVYVALTPLDAPTLRQVVATATADARVRARLDRAEQDGASLIYYVMPWEWSVPEIPMHELKGHQAPAPCDARRHKVVFTRAVLRGGAGARGLDILGTAIRTELLAEAWIDPEGRVTRVLGPSGESLYGAVPVPVF